jgi:environmental stress-induced protein Ves
MAWANGLGRTVELYRREDVMGNLLIRLSVADVVADGPFSSLPGIDRILTLIEGDGFDLDFAGAVPPAPARLFRPVAFSGDWQTSAIHLRGPSRDFNLMTRRGAFAAEVEHLGPGTHTIGTADAALLALYVVAGNARLSAASTVGDLGDLLLIEAENQLTMNLSGDALVIRLKTRG